MNATFHRIWYTPAFSSLLENRREGLSIAGAGALHLGLSLAGLPAWSCPILAATGVPCPGCGLTRATLALVRGDLYQSFQIHAFAPIFLFALIVMLVTLVLPDTQRRKVVATISSFEARNGITAWVLFSLLFMQAFNFLGTKAKGGTDFFN